MRFLYLISTTLLVLIAIQGQAQEESSLPANREELTHFYLLAKESKANASEEMTKAQGRMRFHRDRLSYLLDRLGKARQDVDMRTVCAGQALAGGGAQDVSEAAFLLREAESMALLLQQQVQPITARVEVAKDEVNMWAEEVARTSSVVLMLENAMARLPQTEVVPAQAAGDLSHEAVCPICRRRHQDEP